MSTTKKPAAKKSSTKGKPTTKTSNAKAKVKRPAPPADDTFSPADEANTPYAGFEAYDVVQISDEGSSTWTDFDSIRTAEEGEQARKMCELTGPRTYRIVSGDKQTVKVSSPGAKAKTTTKGKHTKATPPAETTEQAPELVEGSLSESFREAADIHGIRDPPTHDTKPRTNATGPKKLSALDAAAQVLATTGEAMNCQELVAAMREQGLWTSPGGKTPAATLHAAISTEIRRMGNTARFTKAGRGKFTLRTATAE